MAGGSTAVSLCCLQKSPAISRATIRPGSTNRWKRWRAKASSRSIVITAFGSPWIRSATGISLNSSGQAAAHLGWSGKRTEGSQTMAQDVVLGAGIAGLAAAHYSRQHGRALVLYEAGARPGGILDSFSIDYWRFDNGVQLSFGSDPYVHGIFDQTDWIEHEPLSLCWDNGYWLRYPVQNNMFPLPAKEKVDLIVDLIARPELKVETYRDWLIYQY